jgi:hypothetical protein
LMVRDDSPKAQYVKSVPADNPRGITRLFPLSILTYDLLARQRIPLRFPILKALLSQNVAHHLKYMHMFHPQYVRIIKCIWRVWYRNRVSAR